MRRRASDRTGEFRRIRPRMGKCPRRILRDPPRAAPKGATTSHGTYRAYNGSRCLGQRQTAGMAELSAQRLRAKIPGVALWASQNVARCDSLPHSCIAERLCPQIASSSRVPKHSPSARPSDTIPNRRPQKLRGSVQPRFIPHRCATSDKTLFVMWRCEAIGMRNCRPKGCQRHITRNTT